MIPHRRHRTQVGVAPHYVIDLLEDTYVIDPAFSPEDAAARDGRPRLCGNQSAGRGLRWASRPSRRSSRGSWPRSCGVLTIQKAGLIYCFNRPSSIYLRDLDEDVAEKLCDDAVQRSPRWNGDGSRLAFLASAEQFETHDGAVELKVWSAGKVDVVVEAPLNPDYRQECPGLWACPKLLEDCWSGDTSS